MNNRTSTTKKHVKNMGLKQDRNIKPNNEKQTELAGKTILLTKSLDQYQTKNQTLTKRSQNMRTWNFRARWCPIYVLIHFCVFSFIFFLFLHHHHHHRLLPPPLLCIILPLLPFLPIIICIVLPFSYSSCLFSFIIVLFMFSTLFYMSYSVLFSCSSFALSTSHISTFSFCTLFV